MSEKPRPTDAEFEELKRKRDAAIKRTVERICEKHGLDPATARIHVSGAGGCYCACPDGPCQHIWDGPAYHEENMMSVTCSRCGAPAIYHDMRVGP